MRMRRTLVAVLIGLSAVMAEAAPPARPTPITPAQFAAMRAVESRPEHQAVLTVHATYTSERERQMETTRLIDDITTAMTYVGEAGLIIGLLICAAPL